MVRLAFIVGTFYPALLTVGLAAPYPNLYVGSNSSLATTNFSSGTINYANAFVGYSDVGNTANVVSNTLSIVFAGTVLNLSSNAYIGYNGYNGSNNEMEVAAGGVVTDSNGYIGYSNNSSGNYASVLGSENGSNSLWSNSGTLTVGYSGGGTLTLANGGTVVAAGGLTIASNSGSVGTLNIGSYGGSDTSGILIAPTISFGSGTGTINFNQTNAFTLTNAITGAGSIQQLGTGTTILTGSNTYSLGTVITAGTLQIGDGITDGSIQGNVTNSAQLVFDPAASSTALFSGTVTNVGANSDVLISSGTLQLGNGSSTSSILGFTDTNSDGGSGGKALTATNGANFLNSTSAFISGGYGGKGSGGSSNGYSATAGSGGGAGGGAVSYAGTGILSNAGSIGGGFGGNGGNGATGSSEGSSGGSGGAGGGGISFAGMGVMSNSGSVTGGYGGSGGYGGNANYSSEYASYAGSGGSGGAGGGGISFAGMGVLSNSGSITGGAGGNGGAGGYALNNNSMGGAGGNAGNGVSFGGIGFLTNSGTIAGGSSGNGGYNGNFPAISGNGGMGVSFIGSGTLINSGTISGGNNGFSQFGPPTPSLALGVVFSGASNTLVNLGSGTINGGVSMAGSNNLATLFTGGVIKGPLDIGGAQSSTLTLDGQGTASWSTAVTGTTSFGGSLIKQGAGTWKIDSSLGNPTSALITAGTLQAEITNALGAGEVTLTNSATLSLATNLIVSSLLWNSTATVALNPNTYLTSTGVVTLTGAGTNDFNLSGWSLGSSPVELLSYGSGSLLSTKDFSALGVSGYTLSQSNNALWIFINLPDLYVGSNSTVTPTNFTSGTNIYGNTYVGYATNADKNLLTISGQGTILTNSTYLEVGVSGSGNRMVVTNGGVVTDATGNIGLYAEASNNSVLVAGAGSTWSNRFNINVGEAGSSNSVVISGGGKVFDENGFIDSPEVNSSNNSVLVTGSGSLWSNNSDLYVGASGTSNRLVISSGATVIDSNGYIDRGLASSNNSALVTGSNSLWSNNGVLYVGYEGTGNMLSISNGGRVVVTGNTNTNDYVIGNGFVIGYAINSSNSTVTVTGSNSLLTNTSQNNDSFNVGWYGSSNSLVISNGGTVDTKYGNIGYTNGTGNSVLVTGSNSAWNGSELYVGHWNSGNSLTVSAGGHVLLDSYLGVGSFQPGANSNTAIISGAGSLLSVGSSGEIDVGGENGFGNSLLITNKGAVFSQTAIIGSYGGDTNISSSNSALVTGAGSVWTNTGTFTIGQTGGANSLVITNGAHVINGGDAVIGDFRTAQSNSVLVTGAGSLWSNAGTLTIGNSGSGALTLSATSAVSASSIVIASQEGSSGTVNIGTPGGNSPGGMLSTPAITFGNGSGALNFDQSNTAALTSTISGVGTIQQLGSGTSILSASNSYSGGTGITKGTLLAASTNALGVSAVSLNGGTLSLQTNLSIGSLVWNSSGTLALPELGKGDFLDVTGSLSLAGPSTNNFSLSQSALGSIPTELLGWGSTNSEFGTGNFSLPGVNNYYLSISNNALWAQILTNLYVGSNSTVAATNFISGSQLYFNTYVGFSSKASKNLLSVSGPNTLLRNITNLTVGVAGSGNSMVISNGGTVLDVNGSIGSASTSLSNSVLVTGAGSSWSNSGSVTIGNAGSGILTVTSGGNVVAQGGIMIAAQTGSSGTLGIGSLPSSAGSGTLTTPDITFGLGKGTILTSGTWQAGSNAILPGTPLFVDDPFQVALTNSTLNLVIPLGGLTNSGSFTYTFNRSGSSFYEIATTNGVNLQPIADTTWDNTSTNWHTNSGGPALVFAPDDNFLYNATFSATGTLTVPTNGVTANQVNFIDILDQNIGGGVINATSFTKSGSGLLNISNNLSLIGSFSNTGAGSANLSGTILSGSITQSGTGTLNLSGKNSYGGGTVLSGGTLAIGNNSAFGSGSLYVEGNGTLSGSSTLNVANPLTILGKSVLTLNVTGTSNSLSESGAIGGTGSLLKTGTGSVTLSGSNSFTGGATITQGILAASSLGSGALLIAPAKGNQAGFIDTLASGTLSLGAITMSGGSTLGIENPYGSILSSGAISITGTNNFIDLSGAWTNLGTYSLLTGSKLTGSGLKVLDLSGSFLGGADLLLGKTTNYGGLLYSFTDTSSALELSISPIQKVAMLPLASIYSSEGDVMSVNPGVLTLQAVPEPSAYPLLGLGVLALLSVLKLRRLSIRNSKTTRPNSGNIVSKMRF